MGLAASSPDILDPVCGNWHLKSFGGLSSFCYKGVDIVHNLHTDVVECVNSEVLAENTTDMFDEGDSSQSF